VVALEELFTRVNRVGPECEAMADMLIIALRKMEAADNMPEGECDRGYLINRLRAVRGLPPLAEA